jgi:hypothetical protein
VSPGSKKTTGVTLEPKLLEGNVYGVLYAVDGRAQAPCLVNATAESGIEVALQRKLASDPDTAGKQLVVVTVSRFIPPGVY